VTGLHLRMTAFLNVCDFVLALLTRPIYAGQGSRRYCAY
jgi:hypothetical protein